MAAIDIGSNAIRLCIAEKDHSQKIKVIHSRREALRLGKESFTQGEFSPKTQKCFLKAMESFQKAIEKHEVTHVRAVATSACRCSKNGPTLINKANDLFKLNIEIIDGQEEGKLIRRAVLPVCGSR